MINKDKSRTTDRRMFIRRFCFTTLRRFAGSIDKLGIIGDNACFNLLTNNANSA